MQQLEYAPRPKWRRPRAIYLAILTAMLALAFAIWHYRHGAIEQYRLFELRRAVANFHEPAGTVVYDEDPDQANTLISSGKYQRVPYAGTLAGTDWNPVVRILPKPLDTFRFASALIFLHELKLPNGEPRVIFVSLRNENEEELGQGRVVTLSTTVLDLRKNETIGQVPWKSLQIPGLAPGDRVRVMAGQMHRTDPSAFSIAFQINDKKQLLRGKLLDNAGNVELSFE